MSWREEDRRKKVISGDFGFSASSIGPPKENGDCVCVSVCVNIYDVSRAFLWPEQN